MTDAKKDSKTLALDVGVQTVAVASLRSETNDRETINRKSPEFLALVDSIRAVGIIHKPTVTPDGAVVAGARRCAAASMAGLTEIEVNVRSLTAEQISDIRLIENLHRRDLTPIEESDAFERLASLGATDEEIAERAAVSVSTVQRRRRLQSLPTACKRALRNGDITVFVATAIARIPSRDRQKEALEIALKPDWHGDRPSDRAFASQIRRQFLLALETAPFDIAATDLHPKRGACASCHLNTAFAPALFDDVADVKGGMCTDDVCWASKTTATITATVARYRESGLRVYDQADEKDAPKIKKWLPYGNLAHNAPFMMTDKVVAGQPNDGKKTLKTLIGKKVQPVVLVEREERGVVIEVYPADDVKNSLIEMFPRWGKKAALVTETSGLSADEKKRRETIRDEKKMIDTARQSASKAVGEYVETHGIPPSPLMVPMLVTFAQEVCDDTTGKRLIKHYELTPEKTQYGNESSYETVWRYLNALKTDAEKLLFAVDVMVFRYFGDRLSPERSARIESVLTSFGVDHKEMLDLARADMEVEQKDRLDREQKRARAAVAKEKESDPDFKKKIAEARKASADAKKKPAAKRKPATSRKSATKKS